MKYYFVYIVTNKNNTVFYTGVTNNLQRRIYEHKHKVYSGFTSRYNCSKLVWYKIHHNINAAIADEKRIKRWRRIYKINEINRMNPGWNDLYDELV